ncbi:hypothetical protein HAX54_043762, partial [Datura stramonium]|nr:hypothetical protein [Datura stramonium]
LLCDESFSEIIKEEEEEVVGTSNASSTNCTVFELNERKRLHSHSTDDGEEEDGNAREATSGANKFPRVHEAEQGRKEHDDGKNGNQESEQGERGEGGNKEFELDNDDDDKVGENQENNNGDEDKKENEETKEEIEEEEEEKTEELDEGEEGDEGEEDRENDENQEESDNDHNDEEEVERKAAEKGKRPMSEICKLKSFMPKFSNFEEGGPSDTPEGNQIHNDSAKDDTELTDHELTNDYHYDNDDH